MQLGDSNAVLKIEEDRVRKPVGAANKSLLRTYSASALSSSAWARTFAWRSLTNARFGGIPAGEVIVLFDLYEEVALLDVRAFLHRQRMISPATSGLITTCTTG